MAYPQNTNPLFARIRQDGVLVPGQSSGAFGDAMRSTFADLRGGLGPQTDFGAINAAADQPNFNLASLGVTQPTLADTGLHPSGGPTTSFAPTDFRSRAIAAGGAPVAGFGGALATATPNANGGYGFTLTQAPATLPAIDPNPSPAAMNFLATGVAPENPGPLPRLGVPQPTATSPATPFPQPDNSIFERNPGAIPSAGLGRFLNSGNPADVKTAMGLMATQNKMQQDAIERNAIAAAHAPGVEDGLSTYLQNGGRNLQVINSFKKDDVAQGNLKLKQDAFGLKQDAAAQKKADAAQGHATTLSQINEQNSAVMGNIDKAISLADSAGPVAGKTVGTVFAPTGVRQLHALLDSISGNEMMDYIQRLKAANPAGTIGFRVLDTEARAMANVFAAIKNDKVPLEQQDPTFVREQLGNLKYHLARMNAIANGKDPNTANAGGGTSTVNAPQGVDANVWAAMTPQERALWH